MTKIESSEWQPIATAPTDGQELLVCNANSGLIKVAHWDDVAMDGTKGWQVSVVATDWNYYESLNGATHWQHLPAIPTQEAGY